MRESTIARNYAESLLDLAEKAGDASGWGRMIEQVAQAMREDSTLRGFLAAPQVSVEQKNDMLARAFQDRMPQVFVLFLQAVVRNRRQLLIPVIAESYASLLEEREGRLHAYLTVVKPMSEAEVEHLAARLGSSLGRSVVAEVKVDESLLGGMVARIGDTVYDGSVKRKLDQLRRRMLAATV